MLSVDANLFLYAFNTACPEHDRADKYLNSLASNDEIAISEFILCELYVLLRNPAILEDPLSPTEATEVVQSYRRHPRWQIVGYPPNSQRLHDNLWSMTAGRTFARRRIFDTRTALTLRAFGVTDFATANVKNFQSLGFRKVWNPLETK
jgi:uncharacterized protein